MRKTEYFLPAPVRCTLALVTDLHEYDPEPVLEILRQAQPDIIAVAGDTLERHRRKENPNAGSLRSRALCAGIQALEDLGARLHGRQNAPQKEHGYRFLRQAGTIAPVVLSRGNHEWFLTEEDREVLSRAGILLLENETAQIGGICFGGIPSRQAAGALDYDFLEAFAAKPGYKALLCHHPEYYDTVGRYDIDLILSGHCHGGQLRLLGRGLFAPGQGLLPKYHHGVYHGRMVVSAGCANTAPIPRLGNPTEVVILHLDGSSLENRNSVDS